MILGITGHRNIGGYKIPNPTYNYVKDQSNKILDELKPKKVITGMALSFDQLIAELCIEKKISFVAAIPFNGQHLYWTKEQQDKYFDLLSYAESVETVSPGGFATWKLHVRNQWIVDRCGQLLSCYDGRSSGGTYNCLNYAKSKKRNTINIDPRLAG